MSSEAHSRQALVAHRERQGEGSVRAALGSESEVDEVLPVARDDLGAQIGQRLGGLRIRIASDRSRGESRALIPGDRPDEAAALRSGRPDDGDDVLL
jgi:hypothetical protein